MMKRGLIYKVCKHIRQHISCMLLLLIFSGTASAQSSSTGTDIATIKDLIGQADSFLHFDREQGIRLASMALEKSKAARYNKGIFLSLTQLAMAAQYKGDNKKALDFLLQTLPYAELPENLKNAPVVYNNLGLCYHNLGKYQKTLEFYYKALSIVGRAKSRTMDSMSIYSNIGSFWNRIEEHTYALQNYENAMKIATRKKDTSRVGMLYHSMAEVYEKTKQWTLAEEYYRKALLIARNTPDKEIKVIELTNLGMFLQGRKQYGKALEYLNEAMSLCDSVEMTALTMLGPRVGLGAVYLSLKEYGKAKPLLVDALASIKAMNNKDLVQFLEEQVSKVYAATGSYQKAYEHLQAHKEIKDTLLEQEKARSLEVLINARGAEKDKAMLAQQLHITKQKNQLQQKNFWIGGTVLGALLLLSLIVVLMRNYRHKQAIQQAVIHQLQQKQEINQLKAQVRGEEQERQRIARELHDSIASQLWAIKLNVDNMRDPETADGIQGRNLTSIFQQLTDATQDVRKTAHNLMPDLLLDDGLAAALSSVCEKTGKNTRLEVDFQEYGIVPGIDKEIELSIYRMVQELIQNVLKHAHDATHLLVQLCCVDMLLNITVEDNGSTFKENEGSGIGLQQIRKRTMALKGHFDLQHIAGKGTTAYMEFDLHHLL